SMGQLVFERSEALARAKPWRVEDLQNEGGYSAQQQNREYETASQRRRDHSGYLDQDPVDEWRVEVGHEEEDCCKREDCPAVDVGNPAEPFHLSHQSPQVPGDMNDVRRTVSRVSTIPREADRPEQSRGKNDSRGEDEQ